MTIIKTILPKESLLNTNTEKHDYTDSFQGVLNDPRNKFTLVDIGKSFFSSKSKWIEKLFALRNRMVSIFGLKTSGNITNRQNELNNFKCEKGEQLGLFKVFDKTENEIILGQDDKHLNFRVSLFLEEQKNELTKKNLTISTTVEFNNWFGRLYFLPVKPFHKLIVPTMLKGIIRELENSERNENAIANQ
jgi:hypothetical protein